MQIEDTQQQNSATKSLASKELQDARQVINIFIQAWKNYGLYPEDHVNTKRSLENLVAAFNKFFETQEDLRLIVEKDRLLCGSETIYEISPETSSEDIITLLYRDGIKWMEFQEGLPLDEISAFFRIAFKYRSFAEETEGDIVTALMDEELEYIDFKAVDIFWQDLLLIDVPQPPPPAPPPEEAADDDQHIFRLPDRPVDGDGPGVFRPRSTALSGVLHAERGRLARAGGSDRIQRRFSEWLSSAITRWRSTISSTKTSMVPNFGWYSMRASA